MASLYSRLQMRASVSGMPVTLHARLWQTRCSLCSLCQRPVVTSMGIAQRQWHSARLAATAPAADTGTSHTPPSGAVAFSEAPTVSAQDPLPDQPGVYAVFDAHGALQYVGLSRKVCGCTLSKAYTHNVGNYCTFAAVGEHKGASPTAAKTCEQRAVHNAKRSHTRDTHRLVEGLDAASR